MQLELQSIPSSGSDASREVDDLCSALDGNLSLVETCPMCVLCVQKSKSAMSAWGRIGTTRTFPGCGLMVCDECKLNVPAHRAPIHRYLILT